MSREKRETKELTKIAGILTDLCNHDDKADELVEELEGGPVSGRGTEYRNFCKSYVIFIIRHFCATNDAAELMLAAYGLLKGFEFKPQSKSKRLKAYWKYSRDYNQLFENITTEDSAEKTATHHIKKIIEAMDVSPDTNSIPFSSGVPSKVEPESFKIPETIILLPNCDEFLVKEVNPWNANINALKFEIIKFNSVGIQIDEYKKIQDFVEVDEDGLVKSYDIPEGAKLVVYIKITAPKTQYHNIVQVIVENPVESIDEAGHTGNGGNKDAD